MKFSLDIVQEKIKGLFAKGAGSVGRRPLFSPARDWLLVVLVNTVLGVCFIAFGSITFFGVLDENSKGGSHTGETPAVSVDQERLQEVLAVFEARASAYNDLLDNPPQLIDPSE